MSIPTVEENLIAARVHLGDTLTTAGEYWVNAKLLQFHDMAFRMVWNRMENQGLPRIKKTVYHNLPAYTDVLYPSQFGVADFGELISEGLLERSASTTYAVTAASSASPIVVTAPGHPFGSNADVVLSDIGGQLGANGRFFVGVSGNDLTLRGSISAGTYTSGGVVSTSAELFRIVIEEDPLSQRTPTDTLRIFEWREAAFHFTGATTIRQLQINYYSSGAPPQTGSVGIDNSKDCLAALTAALAAPTKDMVSEGQRLWQLVMVGDPRSDFKGLLFELFNPQQKAQQRVTVQRPRFRTKRYNSDYFLAT